MNPKPSNNPVYTIKPKYIFKTPFLKYDLQNPTNRQAQNEELTEYFNYGFNEDTMNIYVKLVNRTLKVLDHKKNLQYFDEPSELMRLNDEIPMDLGGFCKFYDPEVFENDLIKNDQELFKIFLFNSFKATYINGKQYPMLQFVKSMYKPKKVKEEQDQNQGQEQQNPLPLTIDKISYNLQKKYEETMKKLIQQQNQPKEPHPSNPSFKKSGKFQKRQRPWAQDKIKLQKTQKAQKIEKTQKTQKVQIKKKQKSKQESSSSSSSEDSSSSSSSDGSSSSSSESEDGKKKRNRQRKDRSSNRDKSRRGRRQRSKEKRPRDRSSRKQSKPKPRYQDKEKGRKGKDKSKDKNRHRSRSRDNRRRHH